MTVSIVIMMAMLMAHVCHSEKETCCIMWASVAYVVTTFARTNANVITCVIFAAMLFAEVAFFSKKGCELKRNGKL